MDDDDEQVDSGMLSFNSATLVCSSLVSWETCRIKFMTYHFKFIGLVKLNQTDSINYQRFDFGL